MESWDSGEDKIRRVPLGHERVKPAKMGGRRGGREKKTTQPVLTGSGGHPQSHSLRGTTLYLPFIGSKRGTIWGRGRGQRRGIDGSRVVSWGLEIWLSG